MPEERLQKILAKAGLGSRRTCEELIARGRVTVNGEIAHLGQKADPTRDDIRLDGQRVKPAEALVYIVLYKPRFVLSATESDDGRKTVRDLVPVPQRVYPVGRLDLESEGLMLLTNDGELANRLMHPRYGHEKEYRVLVARRPDMRQLDALRHGVVMEDGTRTRPADVRIERTQGKGAWLRIVLKEGKKRQIREMCRLTGLPVVRLIRIRIGPLRLKNMKPGEWRHLTEDEVAMLRRGTQSAGQSRRKSRPRMPRR